MSEIKESDSLDQQIKVQGDLVRQLKAQKADKSQVILNCRSRNLKAKKPHEQCFYNIQDHLRLKVYLNTLRLVCCIHYY